jgi:alcohol dehydrogenase class IV
MGGPVRASASFLFQSSKAVLCALGSSAHVGRHVLEQLRVPPKSAGAAAWLGHKAGTVLVVSDKGITSRGLELKCCEDLARHGYEVVLYDDVVADPPEQVVLDAVALAKEVRASCVVGFGGGSSLDVAKLVALLAHPHAKQQLKEVYGVGACAGERLPLVQVPTTAGTGSEVTPIAIVTTGASEKKGVVSPLLLPDLAVLDGELTATLPAAVTAATGVDAMVHAIEAYTSRLKKNPLSDLLAREALRLLGARIRTVCREPGNLEARSDMLLGSMYAGMSFANAPVAAVHALAYPIGSHFHVPHGLSNALMLPHVLRFNEPVVGDLYAEIAPILFPGRRGALPDLFEELAADLKMPRTLREVGIADKDLELLAGEAMKQTRLLPNNPREVLREDAEKLYAMAL